MDSENTSQHKSDIYAMTDYIITVNTHKGMIKCDNCKGCCSHSYGNNISRFMSTKFGGQLCGTGCSIIWINKCLRKQRKYSTEKRALSPTQTITF